MELMLSPLLAIILLSVSSIFVQAVSVQEDAKGLASTPGVTSLEKRTTITLTSAQVASFKPYTIYAAISVCRTSSLLAWNCANCASVPQFKPVAAGGDGVVIQIWFVGYDPVLDTVIVSFQGTDPEKILPVVVDADLVLTPLNPLLFPGLGLNILTHNGFAVAQSLSAAPVLSAVRTTMSRFNTTHVTVVGHSLGGAIATISVVHLKLHLPPTTTFKLVNYGSPRVGNQAFVDYVNSHFPNAVSRIVNKRDIVPAVPLRIFGFVHVEGELHILDNLSWVSCPGEENPDPNCSIGYVPNLSFGTISDHGGPYDGVMVEPPFTNTGC